VLLLDQDLVQRTAGGILAGGLFILPGVVAIMALSIIYALFGNVGIVAALFFGLKAAVLAIVIEAVVRVGRRALKNNILIGIAAAAFVSIFFKAVYDAAAAIRAANPAPAKVSTTKIGATNAITAAPIEAILGVKGQTNAGMLKIVIGRPATMHGTKVGKEMGINTWAAFAGTDEAAVIDGDFAMTAAELQSVLKAMRSENISVVAIQEPRIFFLHYWGEGRAAALAQSFRRVLDAQAAVH
jgi:hypothetical protein